MIGLTATGARRRAQRVAQLGERQDRPDADQRVRRADHHQVGRPNRGDARPPRRAPCPPRRAGCRSPPAPGDARRSSPGNRARRHRCRSWCAAGRRWPAATRAPTPSAAAMAAVASVRVAPSPQELRARGRASRDPRRRSGTTCARAEPLQHAERGARVAGHAPAGVAVQQAGQGVEDGVDVRADVAGRGRSVSSPTLTMTLSSTRRRGPARSRAPAWPRRCRRRAA